jgi:WD40 repeat protein
MGNDGSRRRYLIAVGITTGLTNSGPQIVDSVNLMVETLCGDFGYQRVTTLDIDPPTEQIRKEIREFCLQRDPDDVVVLYYTGHADDVNEKHRLWTGDTVDAISGTLETGHLAELMLTRTPLRHALIIIDTCFAGQGGAEALRASVSSLGEGEGKTLALLTAAYPREQIVAGDFARLFASAVKQPAVVGHEPPFLALGAITSVIDADRSRPGWQTVSQSVLFGKTDQLPFFPNRRHNPQLRGLDLLTQLRIEQRELRLADLRGHFLPRARGVDVPTEAGWRFVGRDAALRDLVRWLNDADDRSARVVTGGPGSGKSAVIGRLVVLSDPDYRRTVPAEGLSPDVRPPEASIATGVHARGLTSAQVLAALSAQAGVAADTPADLLREMGGRRLTVAIDAVDEALDPADLVAGVLRPLAEAGPAAGLRLLVGTRPHLVGLLGLTGSGAVINLDSERYADPDSIYQYVLRGLESAGAPYAAAGPDLTAEIARAVADAAGHSFLVALIVTRTLLSQQWLPDPADSGWRASLPGTAADAMHADLETRLGAAAERARDLLRPLAFAGGAGLPWESIWAALASTLSGRSYTDEDLIWLRRQAGSYVVEAMESDRSVYRLYHAALAEYLRQGRDEAGVHGAFTAFLISQVPAAARGLDWGRAHPYARAHLATHAQRAGAGQLDHLLCDPGYLINAVPAGVLAALPAARDPAAERAGVAYQRAVHQFRGQPEEQRASYLEFAARIARAPELAAQVDARFPQRRWSIPWTHWPPEYPHRVLGGHLDALSGVLVVNTLEGKHVVVSIGEDANLRTWDLATSEPIGIYPVGAAPLVAARAVRLADHRVIIAVLSSDGLLHLWDLVTATLLRTVSVIPGWRRRLDALLPLDLTLECLTVPGERHFAVVGVRGRGASVWELPSGRQVADLRPPANAAEIGYLETAGGRVVLVARIGVAEHWVFDVQEMRELPVDRGHVRRSLLRSLREALGGTQVLFYALAGGEPAVAVQYSGRSAVVWDLPVGRRLGSWPASAPSAPVRLADGEQVTVPLRLAKEDPDLRGSGLRPLGNPRTTRADRGESDRLEATPTGRFLRVKSLIGPGPIQSVTLAGHTGAVTSYDFLPDADGYVVVTASRDGTVRRWEIQPGKTAQATDDAEAMADREALAVSRIVCAELAGGASVGVASDTDGGVAVWDLRTGHLIRDVSDYGAATAIAVARLESESVGVVADFSEMRIMRLPHGAVAHWRGDRQWWPNDMAGVSLPDGSDVIVTTGHRRKAVVWDLGTGRMRRVLGAHRGWTSCVAHAPGARTGSVVLTGGFDNRVNAWDLSRWWHRRFRVVRLPTFLAYPSAGHAQAIRTARLSDGRMLVLVATLDGMVRVLEAPETMRYVRRTGAITADAVTSATLTNGLLVVITATDGIVRVWDAGRFPPASGTVPLCEINTDVPVTDLDATEHDTVVLATPNGLTAIRLDARLLMDQAAYFAPGVS